MKRTEVRDVIAYLRFAVNPGDEYAFDRIVNKPGRRLGVYTIDNLRAWAEKNGTKYPQCLFADIEDHWKESEGSREAFQVSKLDLPEELRLTKAAKEGIQQLREIYCKLRIAARDASVKGAIQCLMQDCGYDEFLFEEYRILWHTDERLELANLNIEALVNLVPVSLDQDQDKLSDLRRFVQRVALYASTDGSVGDSKGVQLMTTRAMKGCEFSVVILVGCDDGLLPVQREDSTFEEEETRLLFVALTRAKNIVVFSTALRRTLQGVVETLSPSPFFQPLISKIPVVDDRMSLPYQT